MKRFVRILSTVLYIGTIPVAPGTLASLAAFFLIKPLYAFLPLVTLGLILLALWICEPAQRVLDSKDPQAYVLDEVCGLFVSVLWLPAEWGIWVAALILFRAFDILKPWPISAIDKSGRPSAIVWDDVAAGVITNVILQIYTRIF